VDGWIKLHRKFSQWEWFDKSEMVHLFIYFLLLANHEDKKWNGIIIKRGQLVTGRNKIKKQTGISERTIRTCLNRLKSTNEITIKTTNRYSIITICNYDNYQINLSVADQANDQRGANKRPASDHKQEDKEYKEVLMSELLSKVPDVSEAEKIALAFWELTKQTLKIYEINSKEPARAKTKSWVDPIRLAMEKDGRSKEDLREVYEFLKSETPDLKFSWRINIRSGSKLREKFDDLLLASRKNKETNIKSVSFPKEDYI